MLRNPIRAWPAVLVAVGLCFLGPLVDAQAQTVCTKKGANYRAADLGAVCSSIIGDPASSKAAVVDALIVRGAWHEWGQRIQEAKRDYEEGLKRAPEDAMLLGLRAGIHYLENEPKQARTLAERSVQIDPSIANTHNILARIARQAGDLRTALAYYNKAIELSPTYVIAHYDRSQVLKQMGRSAEALVDIEWLNAQPPATLNNGTYVWIDGLRIPFPLVCRIELAEILRKLDRYEEAELAYNKLVAEQPSGFTLTQRSKFLHGLPIGGGMPSRLAAALIDATEAVRLSPQSAQAHLQLSSTLEYSKRPAEALRVLDAALQLEKDVAMRPPILWRRARLLRSLGQLHDAIEAGRESLVFGRELNPEFLLDRLSRLQKMGYWVEPSSEEEVDAAFADAVKACMADEKCW